MPIEQMNVSLPPRMARFIRRKVKAGEYTNASEVVREAVRHMQEAEAAKKDQPAPRSTDLTPPLTIEERESVRNSVQRGVKDFEEGRYRDLDEPGLKQHFAGISVRGKKRLAPSGAKRRS